MLPTITKTENPFERETDFALKDLEQKVIAAAKADGFLNQPHLSGDSITHYFEPFHYAVQHLIHRLAEAHKPQTVKYDVITNNKSTQAQLHEMHNKRGEAEQKKNEADTRLQNTPEPAKRKNTKWVLTVIGCICISEAAMTIGVFEALGFSKIEAFLFAPFLAVVFGFLAHIIPKIYDRCATLWQRRITIMACILILCPLFFGLSIERANFLTQETGHYHSPWPLCILSLVLLGVSIALSYFYLPSSQEKQAINTYNKLVADKETADTEFAAVKVKMQAIADNKREVESAGAGTYEKCHILEQRLISTSLYLLSLYKSTDLKYRTDGGVPDCFDKPYPFSFTTFFDYKQND